MAIVIYEDRWVLAGNATQLVECSPSTHEAQGSISNIVTQMLGRWRQEDKNSRASPSSTRLYLEENNTIKIKREGAGQTAQQVKLLATTPNLSSTP